MTAQEILDDYKRIRVYALTGSLGRNASASVLIAWLNKAVRFIASEAEWPVPSAIFSIKEGVQSYSLLNNDPVRGGVSPKILKVRTVIVNDRELAGYCESEPGFYSLEEWEMHYPGWRDSTVTGSPIAAMVLGTTVYLYPTPDAASESAGKSYINGIGMPNMLDVDNLEAECDFPDQLAEAIPYIAIVKECEDTMETPSEEKRLARKADEASRLIAMHKQMYRQEGTRTPNSLSYAPRQRRLI